VGVGIAVVEALSRSLAGLLLLAVAVRVRDAVPVLAGRRVLDTVGLRLELPVRELARLLVAIALSVREAEPLPVAEPVLVGDDDDVPVPVRVPDSELVSEADDDPVLLAVDVMDAVALELPVSEGVREGVRLGEAVRVLEGVV
jgi:hypothetical protein